MAKNEDYIRTKLTDLKDAFDKIEAARVALAAIREDLRKIEADSDEEEWANNPPAFTQILDRTVDNLEEAYTRRAWFADYFDPCDADTLGIVGFIS